MVYKGWVGVYVGDRKDKNILGIGNSIWESAEVEKLGCVLWVLSG